VTHKSDDLVENRASDHKFFHLVLYCLFISRWTVHRLTFEFLKRECPSVISLDSPPNGRDTSPLIISFR